MRVVSHGETGTERVAARIARTLRGGEVLLLEGDLGTGKTAFVRGLARALGVRGRVTSPTFVLMREYRIPVPPPHPGRGRSRGGGARAAAPPIHQTRNGTTPSPSPRASRLPLSQGSAVSRSRHGLARLVSRNAKQLAFLVDSTALARTRRGEPSSRARGSLSRGKVEGEKTLVHADAYRVRDPRELLHAGLAEWIGRPDAVVAIEWGERLAPLLRGVLVIRLRFALGRTEHARTITITQRAQRKRSHALVSSR